MTIRNRKPNFDGFVKSPPKMAMFSMANSICPSSWLVKTTSSINCCSGGKFVVEDVQRK